MLTFSQLGRYGRFANQLFQIAGTIGIATKHGYGYAFPRWINHDHKERFGSPEDVDISNHFVNQLPTADIQLPDFPVGWGFHDLRVPDNVSISGHLQSERYFSNCIEVIRHYFTMKDEPAQNDACAIHLRLGDYDDHYHTRLNGSYYGQAVSHMPPGTKFLIFSDELESAMDMFRQLGKVPSTEFTFVVNQSYLDDFRLMKTCKHFITGNSSYSLMAAILGRHPAKKIVCPSQWFGPAWNPDTKDLYPENAIIL